MGHDPACRGGLIRQVAEQFGGEACAIDHGAVLALRDVGDAVLDRNSVVDAFLSDGVVNFTGEVFDERVVEGCRDIDRAAEKHGRQSLARSPIGTPDGERALDGPVYIVCAAKR